MRKIIIYTIPPYNTRDICEIPRRERKFGNDNYGQVSIRETFLSEKIIF